MDLNVSMDAPTLSAVCRRWNRLRRGLLSREISPLLYFLIEKPSENLLDQFVAQNSEILSSMRNSQL
jgi:hypothetical protein